MAKIRYSILILFFLVVSSVLYAFKFEPISADFTPSGPDSIQTFRVENTTNSIIAIRITMLGRQVDENGNETMPDAGDLFLVYPSQIVLRPGAVQIVRIQWKGETDISVEKSYRIKVEQLPVDFGQTKKSGGSIDIMFRYIGAAYILPSNPKSDIKLNGLERIRDANGEAQLMLWFSNEGNSHAIMSELQITLEQSSEDHPLYGKSWHFNTEDLAGIAGENILAGHQRKFFLPLPDGLEEGEVRVDYNFVPVR